MLTGEVQGMRLNNKKIECVRLKGGDVLAADLIFSLYGSDPNTELLRSLPIKLTNQGMIDINEKYETSLKHFYAAGDVTNHHSDQIASAVYGGAQATQAANYTLYPARQRLPTEA